MPRRLTAIALAILVWSRGAEAVRGEEGPDELYRLGRYAEAEEAYGRLDMDRPRDLRYRYNRGCAAYQKGDDQAALAAFTSVLRRAEDDAMRHRAAFNIGSIAYRKNDYASAAEWYRRAVVYDPVSEDARYNLELALRQQEKQKEQERQQDQEGPPDGEQEPGEDRDGVPQPGEGGGEHRETAAKEKPGEEQGGRERQDADAGPESGTENQSEGAGRPEEKDPEDLAGELSVSGETELGPEGEQKKGAAVPAIDRQKAEALLDNIREDRARFLRFQVPEEKESGVSSGKDW